MALQPTGLPDQEIGFKNRYLRRNLKVPWVHVLLLMYQVYSEPAYMVQIDNVSSINSEYHFALHLHSVK